MPSQAPDRRQPVALFGVRGRMGQSLVRALRESPQLRLAAAVGAPDSSIVGRDAAVEGPATGVLVGADVALALRDAAVALDFSTAEAVLAHAEACAAQGVPLLVGVTGLEAATRRRLEAVSRQVAVLIAPNTSVGVALAIRFAALAARALGPDFDVEIAEAHHRLKRDAPSGTAIALGEAIAGARGRTLAETAVHERHGDCGPRLPGSIGFAVVRAGDIVGEHTVLFAGDGERLEITHRAADRMIFARGALRAAQWLAGRAPGLYGMADVIGH
jgi:4-hydroxy-tetrahydrodipicolinate reductase